MDIGLSPTPAEYGTWFPQFSPPAFARVFSPLGHGLPSLVGAAVTRLPPLTLPWISHKDPVPLAQVRAFWDQLRPDHLGRRYRWTYHHEAAPGTDSERRDFLAYWRDLKGAAADVSHIELVQIQTNYAMRWREDTRWDAWMIDGVTLGLDCYPLEGFRYEPPASMFGLLEYAAVEFGAPHWGVPELGADRRGAQDRASWLAECVHYLDQAGADFVGLWCSHETRNGKYYDYRPTDADSLATFKSLLAGALPAAVNEAATPS